MSSEKIFEKKIGIELEERYIDYAMSVIVGRAIPDVRDGLKPVHRRILYTMYRDNFLYNRPFVKSAKIVGYVLGDFHPHGDQAIYNSLVRLAQDFSIRYPLIQGHGNFGSVDGDLPAAMRYTEARLAQISNEIFEDITKETVEFVDNFDGSNKEPKVLPSKFPTLLVNGTSGIAVGMSTNMAPHNLTEICNGIIAKIEKPEISITELSKIIKGPDFPTGGIIINPKSILQSYKTGRGKLIVRGKISVETNKKDKTAVVITEIPYLVNKTSLMHSIAKLISNKEMPDIKALRDESDQKGMRIVIELSKDGEPKLVENILYKKTKLQDSFNIINLTLINKGLKPKILNLLELIKEYLNHRERVIYKRSVFNRDEAKKKLHKIEGLLIALDDIDNIIQIIKSSKDTAEANKKLITKYNLTKIQSEAILAMRLSRLTSLERQKLVDDKKNLIIKIKELEEIIADEKIRYKIIKNELIELSKKFGDKRRTQIIDLSHQKEIKRQDLIKIKSNIVILTSNQYIKRLPTEVYQSQLRGGKGKKIMKMDEEDFIQDIFSCVTHDSILFFTSKGRIYSLKCYSLPKQLRTSKGRSIIRLLNLKENEKIAHMIPISKFSEDDKLIFVTKNGLVKKTLLKYFSKISKSGIIAIKIRPDDELITVLKLEDENKDIFIGTKNGYASRFAVKQLKNLGRTAMGVGGIKLRENDEVIGVLLTDEKTKILTLTKKGLGKCSSIKEYRKTSRNAKGVINIHFKSKDDEVIAIQRAAGQDLLIGTKKGQVVRIHSDSIRVSHRVTQGVKAMDLYEDDEVVTIGKCTEVANDRLK